jgi:hypothetical protein
MATDGRSVLLTVLAVALVAGAIYLVDPTFFGLLGRREGFADATLGSDANYKMPPGPVDVAGAKQEKDEKANQHSAGGDATTSAPAVGAVSKEQFQDASGSEGFANLEDVTGPAAFDSAQGPAGCYPRDQLTPAELLPKDPNSVWAQQNPMGTGSLKGKNFLSAGALIGVNTVGQSLRNANLQLRSEPPNPQVPVSVFYNSTIEPDTNRRDLEIN